MSALRAGSYNAREPDWRGVIRDNGWAWYSCTHHHADQAAATRCARAALPALKARDHQDPAAPLPEGWTVHTANRRGGT